MKLLFTLLVGISLPCLAEERLIQGTPAKPGEYPATVYASMSNSRCSATLVGERTLIIAAHCVGNGGKASFKTPDGSSYTSTCTRSSDYRHSDWMRFRDYALKGMHVEAMLVERNATADYALCLVSKPVTGVPFEHLNKNNDLVKLNDMLTLSGYGCTRPGGGGGNDGVLRVGQAKVVDLPAGTDNDIVTRGGAALCFGDSGGPAFSQLTDEQRYLVSINSRGDIRVMSYLSSVSTLQAQRFIQSWKTRTGEKICGWDEDAVGCRNAAPPVPPKTFEIIGKTISLKAVMTPDAKYTVQEAKEKLGQVVQQLDNLSR